MPHYTEYRCSDCGQITLPSLLVAKKVVFTTIGSGPKTIKSRTIGWICETECLPKDADFKREAFSGAPGHKSPALERVRASEARDVQ